MVTSGEMSGGVLYPVRSCLRADFVAPGASRVKLASGGREERTGDLAFEGNGGPFGFEGRIREGDG